LDTTGSPSELEEVLSRQGPGEAEAGRAAVLGHLLGLLNAVVGAELTRQIVGSAWPDLLVKNADFEVEEDEG
jgi:bifunctional ADP-heptose synthase (sugar kinase/adenylyltransferase)